MKTNHPQQAEKRIRFPSLEELIAEIDTETGQTPGQKPRPDVQPAYGYKQYIRFSLEDIMLAIPLASAMEIGKRPDITPLPNLPEWVLGISNIRGEIISLVDLKTFFGLNPKGSKPSPTRAKMFIIVRNQDMKVGLLADKIMGIFSLDRAETENILNRPYKETSPDERSLSFYISGVIPQKESKNKLLNIFDIDRFLSSPRMTAFRAE
jgi:purine-binding chemotaxis protein CheW